MYYVYEILIPLKKVIFYQLKLNTSICDQCYCDLSPLGPVSSPAAAVVVTKRPRGQAPGQSCMCPARSPGGPLSGEHTEVRGPSEATPRQATGQGFRRTVASSPPPERSSEERRGEERRGQSGAAGPQATRRASARSPGWDQSCGTSSSLTSSLLRASGLSNWALVALTAVSRIPVKLCWYKVVAGRASSGLNRFL